LSWLSFIRVSGSACGEHKYRVSLGVYQPQTVLQEFIKHPNSPPRSLSNTQNPNSPSPNQIAPFPHLAEELVLLLGQLQLSLLLLALLLPQLQLGLILQALPLPQLQLGLLLLALLLLDGDLLLVDLVGHKRCVAGDGILGEHLWENRQANWKSGMCSGQQGRVWSAWKGGAVVDSRGRIWSGWTA